MSYGYEGGGSSRSTTLALRGRRLAYVEALVLRA